MLNYTGILNNQKPNLINYRKFKLKVHKKFDLTFIKLSKYAYYLKIYPSYFLLYFINKETYCTRLYIYI
jgi:hypothetical protein